MAVVAGMATSLAYIHNPRWKGFILLLPIPFSVALLSLDRRVDATNMTGLMMLFVYTHSVKIFHYNLKVPIIASIILSALIYCGGGTFLARFLPTSDLAFWVCSAFVLGAAAAFHLLLRDREEPGHRSPLPVPLKLVIITGVIFALVMMKSTLKGFMTIFPMVGVVASYEARHSLWTICRKIPIIMLTLGPMMIAMRLAQSSLNTGWSLAIGWVVLLSLVVPYAIHLKRKENPTPLVTDSRG